MAGIDEVDLAGHPTTVGTRMHLTGPGCETSWCVQKWIDAGAIVIGKLNMHEYGFGEPPVFNSHWDISFHLELLVHQSVYLLSAPSSQSMIDTCR